MECPNDGTPLVMADRQGVEIDYCPQCRGVWLDRGELDKIIERGAEVQRHVAPQPEASSVPSQARPTYHDDDNRRNGHNGKRHRREGFLGEIFDF